MGRWVTRELAAYATETRFEDYPSQAITKAKTLILDNIGCMLGGCQTNLGRALLIPIQSMAGSTESTIVGGRVAVPTVHAAFVNGNTANALDYDDTLLGIGHPGSTIIPAALAIGEWKKASGKDVLTAILIGYDVADRIGKAIQPSYERLQKVWCFGTWQTFGALVSAGKLLQLDLHGMLNAFGIAGATAPLPNTQKWGWEIEERPIHWVKEPTGWPSWTGTMAAILASHGFIGNRFILDGDNGFWIMAGSDKCDFDAMTKGLGKEYEVHNIAIKPYSSCRWQHAALDCVKELKEGYQLKVEEVKSVNIYTFAWGKRQEVYGPTQMVDAEFSFPYTVSMVLLGLHPGPSWYTDENLRSEKILVLSKKIKVEVDPNLDKAYFEKGQLSARVEILKENGERLEKFVDVPKGDPLNPLTDGEREEKFRHLASYSLKDQEIEAVIERVYELEKVSDITELMSQTSGN
jgi:2-methylcitrate dehydratase PrpD